MTEPEIVEGDEPESCLRCGAGTTNRVGDKHEVLCDPCIEELLFWANIGEQL